jgi:hypothetical protein
MLVRRGSRCYYYRSRREAARFTRTYLGSGAAAQLLAAQDQARRLARQEARAAQKAHEDRRRDIDRQLDDLIKALDVLTRASLVVAGYHRHHRSEWRRKHHEPSNQ